jgi:phosphoglycerate dehydrogenase-like enzyme
LGNLQKNQNNRKTSARAPSYDRGEARDAIFALRLVMVRVGIQESIAPQLLQDFTREVNLVRIADEPAGDVEIDMWIAPISLKTVRRQLPHLRRLQVVQSLWAGVDVLQQLLPPGITLCDGQGVHDIPVAEWVVAAILAMQKYLPFYFLLQQQEDWAGRRQAEQLYRQSHASPHELRSPALIDELAVATVLIVGYGSIGKAIEARLAPFGSSFLRVARSGREGVAPVSQLDDLLPQADIVVLITPLTVETRHLMDDVRIARMKRGALLVNAARGPVVDTAALLQALNDKRIRAALDVTDPEPLPPGHPLWKAPNLLITPHIAGASAQFFTRALKLASEQAQRFARGEPLMNVVDSGY